jgi:phosphatidylinositol phospholipase C, delta
MDKYNDDDDYPQQTSSTILMSNLVHYTSPVRFKSFDVAEKLRRSYEMSSFNENRGEYLVRRQSEEFVAYNRRQLSRIYPRGTRFDSTNYSPYPMWSAGCQLVALNYQKLGENAHAMHEHTNSKTVDTSRSLDAM